MDKSKSLEVESGEVAIFSDKGVMAIIPKKNVTWVKKKLAENCHSCIDELIRTLPDMGYKG
jgi:hypothetical protein